MSSFSYCIEACPGDVWVKAPVRRRAAEECKKEPLGNLLVLIENNTFQLEGESGYNSDFKFRGVLELILP